MAFGLAYIFSTKQVSGRDTLFLVNGGNGTPKPCTGNTGLVLAQNLTDLCDVTIINPITNQLLRYNGTQWINVSFTVMNESTTCVNVGTGTAYACIEGTNVHLRSILASTGISVSNNTNTITITNTGLISATCSNGIVCSGTNPLKINGSSLSGQETTVCSGQSGNYNLVASSSGGNCTFKNLVAGSSISLSSNSTHVTITNTSPESTVCTNDGHGLGNECNGGDVHLKGIASGNGITISQNGTDIIITNNSPENTVCTNNGVNGGGAYGLCKDNVINLKGIKPSTGISMTNNTNDVTITNTGVISNSCTSPIVCSGTNPSSFTCSACLTSDVDTVYNDANAVGTNFQIFKNSTTIGSTTTNYFRTIVNSTGLSFTNTSSTITEKTRFANGTGMSITGSGIQTFTNSGVISNSCTSPISCSGTNPSAISCSTCITTSSDSAQFHLVCKVVLGSSNTTINCDNFTAYRNLVVTVYVNSFNVASILGIQFNGDTGNNYASRVENNNAAETTSTSRNSMVCNGTTATVPEYCTMWIYNLASKPKLGHGIVTSEGSSGSANAPNEFQSWNKWQNTSVQITSVWASSLGANTMGASSELDVYGYD